MKKNIEWLKEEISIERKLLSESLVGAQETKVERIFNDGKEHGLIFASNKINQLDEPEVLSQEWIDSKKLGTRNRIPFHLDVDYAVPEGDLQNLLVPKQELPVIPKFVADWIEEVKPDNSLRVAFEYIAQRKRDNYDDELAFWVEEGNSETFAKAWLDGFTVEEERKYVVELPNPNNQMGRHKNVFLNKKDGKVFIDSADLFVNDITKYGQFALTEEEIKKDFEWAWEFAKPVEELEVLKEEK